MTAPSAPRPAGRARLIRVLGNGLLIVSLAITAWAAVQIARRRTEELKPPPRFDRVVKNSARFAAGGFVWGPPNAPHTVVVFSDFECPFCRRFMAVLDSFRARHPDVRVMERNWPLWQIHRFAMQGAIAGECAKAAGRYEQMRHALFANQALMAQNKWTTIARAAGIADTERFEACMRADPFADVIATDMAAARALGARGTPAVLEDSLLFDPPPTLEQMESGLRGGDYGLGRR